jgi:hypothetical protein
VVLVKEHAPGTIIVEARDLDTDECTACTREVDVPRDEAGQRAQLTSVVARLHPEARLRSFGAGAASFIDSQTLVVAHYSAIPLGTTPNGSAGERTKHDEQQSLFAA